MIKKDGMKLWECAYILTNQFSRRTDRWIDYYESTTPIAIRVPQQHWDRINPGGYVVSEFTCKEASDNINPHDCQMHIIERISKGLLA